MNLRLKYPVFKQLSAMDCGLCCLKMILTFYGKTADTEFLRNLCTPSREGISMFGMASAIDKLGFNARGVTSNVSGLIKNLDSPCILHWNNNHFVVLYKIVQKGKVLLQDWQLSIWSIDNIERRGLPFRMVWQG